MFSVRAPCPPSGDAGGVKVNSEQILLIVGEHDRMVRLEFSPSPEMKDADRECNVCSEGDKGHVRNIVPEILFRREKEDAGKGRRGEGRNGDGLMNMPACRIFEKEYGILLSSFTFRYIRVYIIGEFRRMPIPVILW